MRCKPRGGANPKNKNKKTVVDTFYGIKQPTRNQTTTIELVHDHLTRFIRIYKRD